MNLKKKSLCVAAIALCIMVPLASNAASTTYTGSASISSTQVEMPMANGGTVVTANVTGVGAMITASISNPILLKLRCSGLGYTVNNTGNLEFYCTFKENDADQFDVKGTEKSGETGKTGETVVSVIGGSGRWVNATGSGTLKRASTGTNSSNTTFELTIETP